MKTAFLDAAYTAGHTAWKALTEGPEAALTYGLYHGSAWVGTQASEGISWVSKFFGHLLAQIPDAVISSDPKDTYYNLITKTAEDVVKNSQILSKLALEKFAVNAEKAGFSFTEAAGPSLLLLISSSYAFEQGRKTLGNMEKLFTGKGSNPTGIFQKGPMFVVNYNNPKRMKLIRETFISSLMTAIFGSVAYLTGNGFHQRLNEAGVSQLNQGIGLAAIITACTAPSFARLFSTHKQLTQEDFRKFAELQEKEEEELLEERTAARGSWSTGYSFVVPPTSAPVSFSLPASATSSRITIESGTSAGSWAKSLNDLSLNENPLGSPFKDSRQSTLGKPHQKTS